MKKLLSSSLGVALIAVLVIAGCGVSGPCYTVAMVNRTHRDVGGVAVYFGGRMAASKGPLVKGGEATYGFVRLPIPAEAVMLWDDQGVHHAPKVKLEGIVPKNPVDMNIYFIIEEDASVTVKSVPSDDLDANVDATKGIEKLRDQRK